MRGRDRLEPALGEGVVVDSGKDPGGESGLVANEAENAVLNYGREDGLLSFSTVPAEGEGARGRSGGPKGASGNTQVVHWHITGGADGDVDSFQTVMAGGSCTVTERTDQEFRTALTMPGTEFLKVVTNNANPVTLFMTRKLKVEGDVGFATALQKMFTIPSA